MSTTSALGDTTSGAMPVAPCYGEVFSSFDDSRSSVIRALAGDVTLLIVTTGRVSQIWGLETFLCQSLASGLGVSRPKQSN